MRWPGIRRQERIDGDRGRRRQKGELDVAAAVMVVMDRPFVSAGVGGRCVLGRLAVGRLVVVVVVMVMVMLDSRCVGIGDTREVQAMLDPMSAVDRPMRLQRDDDGHPETDAEEAKQSRQWRSPEYRPLGGIGP